MDARAGSVDGGTASGLCSGAELNGAGAAGCRRTWSHGNSQSALATPSTMKKSLQPARAMSMPPISVPTAGPQAWPAEMSELARPRWDSEKWREMILLYEG